MEMQLKPELVRAERERRAWTQEHVSHLSGLGVRTIQRVEAKGVASVESARALSAVLEIPLAELRAASGNSRWPEVCVDAVILIAGALTAMLFTPPVLWAQVPVLIIFAAYFFGRHRTNRIRVSP